MLAQAALSHLIEVSRLFADSSRRITIAIGCFNKPLNAPNSKPLAIAEFLLNNRLEESMHHASVPWGVAAPICGKCEQQPLEAKQTWPLRLVCPVHTQIICTVAVRGCSAMHEPINCSKVDSLCAVPAIVEAHMKGTRKCDYELAFVLLQPARRQTQHGDMLVCSGKPTALTCIPEFLARQSLLGHTDMSC